MQTQEDAIATPAPAKRTMVKALAVTTLLIVSIVIAVLIDSEALVASAYHWPFILWRITTYGVLFYKVKPRHYLPMTFCVSLNELAIYAHWSGAQA